MKSLLRSFVASVKRNPVINAALTGIALEAINHAVATGDFKLKDIAFYAFQLGLAMVAREFVVPLSEHNEMVANNQRRDSND